MLLNHQQRKILELLCKTEHVTASELAGQLGIGVKTVRVRIKELNPELEKKGIQIYQSPGTDIIWIQDSRKVSKDC